MHTIIVSEGDTIKSWSFEADKIELPQHGGKRKSMRNRLSVNTNTSQHSGSPLPSPRSQFIYTTQREINDELRVHEKERNDDRQVKEFDRKQYMKYNGVDVDSPGYSRMNEDEITEYLMCVSREGSFKVEDDGNLLASKLKESEGNPGITVNDYETDLQLALMLSLEDQ